MGVNITLIDNNQKSDLMEDDQFSSLVLNLEDESVRRNWVTWSDLVVSLLPPHMHLKIAKACLDAKKPLLTASYTAPEIMALDEEAKKQGIFIAMELGLDPGIDHLTALSAIQVLKDQGAEIETFESYCGGLVAVEDEDNPLKYKISWNPSNVVNAAQAGVSTFKYEGRIHQLLPARIFKNPMKIDFGASHLKFEMYPNRDSLVYIPQYGLENAKTFIRGTLRRPPFCKCWQAIIDMGWVNNSITIKNEKDVSWKEMSASFQAPWNNYDIHDDEVQACFEFLGLNNDETIGLINFTPSQALEKKLVEKLKYEKGQKDRVVMIHRIGYVLNGKKILETHLMDEVGDEESSAMSKWVGMPLLAMIELWTNGAFNNLKGVVNTSHPKLVMSLTPRLFEMGLSMTKTII